MIRDITTKDLNTVYDMNQEIFKDEIVYDKQFINRFCKINQGFICYDDNNKAVGYILYGMINWKQEREFTIVSVGVKKEARGKGYGKMLMNEVINRYPNVTLCLNVRVMNAPAQKLYKSLGFNDIELVKDYYYQLKDDAYHMKRHPN